MQPEASIQPINVVGATLLVQLLLISILGVGGRMLQSRRTNGLDRLEILAIEQQPATVLKSTPLTFLVISSFTFLLLSEDLYGLWSPLFPGLEIRVVVKTSTAIFVVYLLNLLAIAQMMYSTGGSSSSPFLSALFTIPALAIFLRLPPWAFITIAVLSAVIYAVLLAPGLERKQASQSSAAFMNLSCLALAMLTGYVTRPVDIIELDATKKITHLSMQPLKDPDSQSNDVRRNLIRSIPDINALNIEINSAWPAC